MKTPGKSSGDSANTQPGLTPDPALDETLRRLLASYQPLEVYLSGSKARGDSGPDSDYDLLVVVPDDAPRSVSEAGWPTRSCGGRAWPLTSSSVRGPTSSPAGPLTLPCRARYCAKGGCCMAPEPVACGL